VKGHWAVLVILILGFGLQNALAFDVSLNFNDVSVCDPLSIPPNVHELGEGTIGLGATGPFPLDEEIDVEALSIEVSPCPTADNPIKANFVVSITNVSPITYVDLWYVAEPTTAISNIDGTVTETFPLPGPDGFAFRIDSSDSPGGCGAHCPLFSETLTSDGVFEPGETWDFIIQDYAHTSLGPSAINSLNFGSSSTSSGSILAVAAVESPVGGTYLPIDQSALLLAGAQSISMWMIPVILAGVVVGVFVIKRKK